jgi:hypothetical protein
VPAGGDGFGQPAIANGHRHFQHGLLILQKSPLQNLATDQPWLFMNALRRSS